MVAAVYRRSGPFEWSMRMGNEYFCFRIIACKLQMIVNVLCTLLTYIYMRVQNDTNKHCLNCVSPKNTYEPSLHNPSHTTTQGARYPCKKQTHTEKRGDAPLILVVYIRLYEVVHSSLAQSGYSMPYVFDFSVFVRMMARNIPDLIVLVFFVASIIVLELSLDLLSPKTRNCVL